MAVLPDRTEPDMRIMWAEAAARLLQTLDIMRNSVGTAGYPIDETAAARAVGFLLDEAAGKQTQNGRDQKTIRFLTDHGIDLDWIFRGRINGLVVGAIMHEHERDAIAR